MKKILMFILALCITLNSCAMCVFAESDEISFSFDSVQNAIADLGDKLYAVDAIDRSKSFLIIKAYLSTDEGVDALVSIIENDEFDTDPGVADIYKVIGDITDNKEQLVFTLKFTKCFTPDERIEVLERFLARDDIGFKAGVKDDIRDIFEAFNPDATIDIIDDQNRVTGAMIASLFSIFEGHIMLTDVSKNSSDFEVKKIYSTFDEKFTELLSEYTIDGKVYTAEEFIENLVNGVNDTFDKTIKNKIKNVFGVVGIYTPKASSSSSSRPSGGSISVIVKPGTGSEGITVDRTDMTQYGSEIPNAVISPDVLLEEIAKAEGLIPDIDDKPITEPGVEPGTEPGTGTGSGSGASAVSRLYGFDDCREHWSDGITTLLKYKGTLKGDAGTNDYRPDFKINREEMAAIVMRYLEERDGVKASNNNGTRYLDAKDTSSWAVDSIAFLSERGILKGYPDGEFKPKKAITREEAAAIVSRVLDNKYRPVTVDAEYVDETDIGDWANWDVHYVSNLNIATGYSTGEFLPKNNITRAEIASFVYKMMCVENMIR